MPLPPETTKSASGKETVPVALSVSVIFAPKAASLMDGLKVSTDAEAFEITGVIAFFLMANTLTSVFITVSAKALPVKMLRVTLKPLAKFGNSVTFTTTPAFKAPAVLAVTASAKEDLAVIIILILCF